MKQHSNFGKWKISGNILPIHKQTSVSDQDIANVNKDIQKGMIFIHGGAISRELNHEIIEMYRKHHTQEELLKAMKDLK